MKEINRIWKTRRKEETSGVCSVGEYCFLLYTAILSILKALGFYEGQSVFTTGLVAAFCCLLISLLCVRKTMPQWLAAAVLLAIGFVVYWNTGEKSLLVNFGFLAGMIGLSRSAEKRIFRTGALCWGGGFLVLTFLCLTGLHSEQLFMHEKKGIGFVLCHSLGYAHSNVLHISYLCISAMILYLAGNGISKKQKLGLVGILLIPDLYIFLYSMSYTGFLASILLYALYLYGSFRGRLSRAEKLLAEAVLPACLLFALAGPLVIKGTLFDKINSALNTRYELTRWFFLNQPVTAFGTRMEVPNYRYTLDCSYAYLFMRLGVVPFAILAVLYLGTIHQLVKEQRLSELAIVLGLCIAGVTEPFLFNLSFKNVTLVFVGEYLSMVCEGIGAKDSAEGKSAAGKSVAGMSTEGKSAVEKSAEEKSAAGKSAAGKSTTRKSAKEGYPAKRVCVFPSFGEKPVKREWMIADRALEIAAKIREECRRHRLGYLLAGVLTLFLTCLIAVNVTRPAQIVFISDDINEEWQSDRDSMILSNEDVTAFEEEGNFVYGYTGPEEKMYIYTGRTASIEYDRRIVSLGIWLAGAVVIGTAAGNMIYRQVKEL